MQLKVLGSSSDGNCYLLENDYESIIIDCGFEYSKIQKFIDFNISKVVGVLLTHADGDHSKATKQMLLNGFQVYSSIDCFESLQVTNDLNAKVIQPQQLFKIGNFKILPFDVQHDVPTLGFYIYHPDCGNVLFATDTFFLKYTFPNLNNIIIEANYCEDILEQREKQGNANTYISNRVRRSHMSIQQCIKTLQANDLSNVNNIVLIHLSDGNSHEIEFKEKTEKATGKTVHVADAGMIINFGKTPF